MATEVWTQQVESADNDYAYSVSVGADGSVLIAGRVDGTLPGQTDSGIRDAFVMKLAEP